MTEPDPDLFLLPGPSNVLCIDFLLPPIFKLPVPVDPPCAVVVTLGVGKSGTAGLAAGSPHGLVPK